jgi:hypothetical protein
MLTGVRSSRLTSPSRPDICSADRRAAASAVRLAHICSEILISVMPNGQRPGPPLGGRISLQSPAGAGTILQIALPLDDPSGPGRPTAGLPDEAGRGPAANPGRPGPG